MNRRLCNFTVKNNDITVRKAGNKEKTNLFNTYTVGIANFSTQNIKLEKIARHMKGHSLFGVDHFSWFSASKLK